MQKQLAVFERTVLRRILAAVCDGCYFRRRYSDELIIMYGELDIVSTIRLSRLRWIGHVSRMAHHRKVYQVCYNQPEGKE